MNKEYYIDKYSVILCIIQSTEDPLVLFAGGIMKKGAGGHIYRQEEVLKKWPPLIIAAIRLFPFSIVIKI